MRNTCFFVLLALGLSARAIAADEAPQAPKEKKICRKDVDTGTIMPRSVCRTRTEWTEIDAAKAKQTERDTQALRNRSTSGGLGGD